jgi:hypothetical protein
VAVPSGELDDGAGAAEEGRYVDAEAGSDLTGSIFFAGAVEGFAAEDGVLFGFGCHAGATPKSGSVVTTSTVPTGRWAKERLSIQTCGECPHLLAHFIEQPCSRRRRKHRLALDDDIQSRLRSALHRQFDRRRGHVSRRTRATAFSVWPGARAPTLYVPASRPRITNAPNSPRCCEAMRIRREVPL